jgi:hypothetical protein
MNFLRSRIFRVITGVLLASALASARTPTDYSAIRGTWVNSTSRSLVKIVIGTDTTGRLFLHAYGACSPIPCDWGTVYPAAWSGSPGSATVKAVAATYGSSTAPISELLNVNLIYVNGLPTQLRVNLFTQFNLRGDPRYNYWATELMSKK